MTRRLLTDLNGNCTGKLKSFLDTFKGEPRIAWYPSAGEDFRALVYLHPGFAQFHPSTAPELQSPDLFLYTDYSYYPRQNSTIFENGIIYSDDRTRVFIESVEELPKLNLPLHDSIVNSPNGGSATDRAFFLRIKIESNRFGSITYPVLYAFAENETFFCKKLIPNKARISHIIQVRYGGGCGGGGKASGAWLLNVLNKLNCEVFITDGHHNWQSGDRAALRLCPDIPKENHSQLTPIRLVPSDSWSGHGNVSWNLVS